MAHRDPTTEMLSRLGGKPEAQYASEVKERRWQWARPQVEGRGPCPRGGHTATLVGPTDSRRSSARIFFFGGHYDGGDGKGFVYLNDTFVLDIDENTWMQPRCRGTAPEPRYGHSSALVGTRIVYFGGKGKTQHLRDLHALDSSTLTWYQGPSSGGAPAARHGHTATLHGTRLYIFGGACNGKCFGDLHCLDLASMAWSSPETTGPKPQRRFGHAALLVGDSLVIHGGYCTAPADIATKDTSGDLLKSCYLNDIRVLDLGRLQWSRLRTHGQPPPGRFGHTLVLSEDDAVLFGGWAGMPKEAPGVAFSLRDKVRGETKPAKTGQDQDETCDYCATLRTADMQWVWNKYVGVPPPKRYGHTATAVGPHLIIFGGWDGGKPLSDVVVLRDRTVAEKHNDELDLFDEAVADGGGARAAAAAAAYFEKEGQDRDEWDRGADDFELETGDD